MSDVTEKEIVVQENDDGTATFQLPEGDKPLGRTESDRESQDDTSGGGGDQLSRNARRRARMKEARARREHDIDALTSVVHSQQKMIHALAHGQYAHAARTLQREAEDCRAAYSEAQARHAKAVADGDGPGATEAMHVMQNASTHYQMVAAQYNRIAEQMKAAPASGATDDTDDDVPRQQPQDGVPRLTRTQLEKAEEFKDAFLDQHPDIDLGSDDDRIVAIRAIDGRVLADGFKPHTQDYWDELSERLREAGLVKRGKTMHQNAPTSRRRQDDDDERAPPRGGAGRDGVSGGGTNVGSRRLRPEQIKALEDAGIPLVGGGDDMVRRRNKVLKAWANGPQQ